MGKLYFVGHTRGPDFNRLRALGFLTFYPTLDDYVFLEDKPEHLPLLRKQTELGLAFVKNRKGLIKVTEEEINRIQKGTTEKLGIGAKVLAVEGPAANLEGEVLDESDLELFICFKGYQQDYTLWCDRQHIVLSDENLNQGSSDVR